MIYKATGINVWQETRFLRLESPSLHKGLSVNMYISFKKGLNIKVRGYFWAQKCLDFVRIRDPFEP